MAVTRSVGSTLIWYAVLAFIGVLVVCSMFAVFVPGPERGQAFYVAASIVCFALLVSFTHLAHSKLAALGVPTATPPTRIQVQILIGVWLVLAIVTAILAANPEKADTFYTDRVFMVYLVLTFLFFAAAFFLYSKDIEVEAMDQEVAEERRSIQFSVPDVESVKRTVAELGERFPAHALLADRVGKRVDMALSGLEAVHVSASRSGFDGPDWNAALAEQVTGLVSLSSESLSVEEEGAPDLLNRLAAQADLVVSTLRKRERALMA
ncbi:MAG: hypothetical protein GY851_22960 [bacterium]|nr:hypothetical protein [bacterium]